MEVRVVENGKVRRGSSDEGGKDVCLGEGQGEAGRIG